MLLSWTSLAVMLSLLSAEPAARGDKSRGLTNKLKHDLLTSYDKLARPSQFSDYIKVNFTLCISHILVDWVDDKLRWNASEYGGLTSIVVTGQAIWRPDIFFMNSAVGEHKATYLDDTCIVFNNGSVYWTPNSRFSAYCTISLRWWPYDKQVCQYFFSSWIEENALIGLTVRDKTPGDEHAIREPSEWDLLDVLEVHYSAPSHDGYIVKVVVTAYRVPSGYRTVVFAPAMVCVMLTLATFWVPTLSPGKILALGVNVVITTILLVYFSQLLPITTPDTPFIVEFYASNLVLVCISMIVSISLSEKITVRTIQSAVNRLLSSPVSAFLRLDHVKYFFKSLRRLQECNDLQEEILEMEEPNTQQNTCSSSDEGILLITVLDRVMFILYLLVFSFMWFTFYRNI